MSRPDEARDVSVGDRLYRVCGTPGWRRPEDTYQLAERVVVDVRSTPPDRVRVDQPFPGDPPTEDACWVLRSAIGEEIYLSARDALSRFTEHCRTQAVHCDVQAHRHRSAADWAHQEFVRRMHEEAARPRSEERERAILLLRLSHGLVVTAGDPFPVLEAARRLRMPRRGTAWELQAAAREAIGGERTEVQLERAARLLEAGWSPGEPLPEDVRRAPPGVNQSTGGATRGQES